MQAHFHLHIMQSFLFAGWVFSKSLLPSSHCKISPVSSTLSSGVFTSEFCPQKLLLIPMIIKVFLDRVQASESPGTESLQISS